ncbi:MAG: fumarylacetoacetate hydrolase family protein [Pseudomonadota bacterium]
MKLATIKNGTRDGRLAVVSKNLSRVADASHIAPNMRSAIDSWSFSSPRLMDLAETLETDTSIGEPFDPATAHAPMPRAVQWADGSAYVNHVELVRKARGVEMPESFWTDPLMYMGAPDAMLGAQDDIVAGSTDWGIDMEAEVAVFLNDVPMGVSAEAALNHVLMVAIINDVSYRNLIAPELGKGFGFFQSKGPTAFSPVAATPDELGQNWRDGKLHLAMDVIFNGNEFGKANAGVDMTFDFGQLIAHAAKTRPISAGAILGSGTVSNKLDGGPGKPVSEGGVGYSCIAEIRTIETIETGEPTTPFMQFGDTVEIDMKDQNGASIFGTIRQQVVEAG